MRRTVTEDLRMAILRSQLTRRELADRTGVTESSLSRFLNYKSDFNGRTINQFAIVLNLRLVSNEVIFPLPEQSDHNSR